MRLRLNEAAWVAAIVVLIYSSLSMWVYSLAHPTLTQTQVMLDAWRAITWSWLR